MFVCGQRDCLCKIVVAQRGISRWYVLCGWSCVREQFVELKMKMVSPMETFCCFVDSLKEDDRDSFDEELRCCVDGFLDKDGECFWGPVLMEQGGRLLYCNNLYTHWILLDGSGLVDDETDVDVVDEVMECLLCGYSFDWWWRVPNLSDMKNGYMKRGLLDENCEAHDDVIEFLYAFWICCVKLGYRIDPSPLEKPRSVRWERIV